MCLVKHFLHRRHQQRHLYTTPDISVFNVNKCKVMHIGKTQVQHPYYMNSWQLEVVDKERLGYYCHK